MLLIRKLYGRIKGDFKKGDVLVFDVSSSMMLICQIPHSDCCVIVFPVSPFNGKKSLLITTTSWLGMKNKLGTILIVFGSLSIGVAVLYDVLLRFCKDKK